MGKKEVYYPKFNFNAKVCKRSGLGMSYSKGVNLNNVRKIIYHCWGPGKTK